MQVDVRPRGTTYRSKCINRTCQCLEYQIHRMYHQQPCPLHRAATETSCDTSQRSRHLVRSPPKYCITCHLQFPTSNPARATCVFYVPAHTADRFADPAQVHCFSSTNLYFQASQIAPTPARLIRETRSY